jgi:hypothetical protein
MLDRTNVIAISFVRKSDVATTISLSHEPAKKRAHVIPNAISSFFYSTNQLKKDNET